MRDSFESLFLLARPGRFELPTPWFEAKYSVQLSYRRIVCDRLIESIQSIKIYLDKDCKKMYQIL